MSRQERSETSLIIEKTKSELVESLKKVWKSLYWEPEVKTPQGCVKGISVDATKNESEIVYLSQLGRIIRADKDKSEEVDLPTYLNLAPKAENILKELRVAQRQEIENDPEGRDVLWRPGQCLFGKWYCPYTPFGNGREDTVITVRAKRDGLYCPKHPEMKLIAITAHSEDGERFSDCPVKDCSFSVYNGT